MVVRTALAALILCAGITHADEALLIESDHYVVVADPIVLVCPGEHDLYDWRSPLDVEIAGDGARAEVTARAGRHSIACVGTTIDFANEKVSSVRYVLTFQTGETGTPPPPQAGDWSRFETMSEDAATLLDDPPTSAALVASFDSFFATDLDQPLDVLQGNMKVRVESVMLARDDESRAKDWFGLWRVPINEELDRAQIRESTQYIEILQAVKAGLRARAPPTSVTKEVDGPGSVLMITSPTCVYCEQWKQKEWKQIEQAGYLVTTRDEQSGVFPRYEITANGKTADHTGYMVIAQFNSIIQELWK